MKRLIVLLLIILLYSVPSSSQGGFIGLYLDPWGGICEIEDCKLDILNVYVVHKLTPAASASQFRVISSSGFTGVYLGDVVPQDMDILLYGSSQDGIAIAYGGCYESPVHILTIRYLVYGTSEPNSYIEVVGDSNSITPGLIMVDCNANMYEAMGGRAYINGDGSFSCSPTPTASPSWGGIKALYR